MDKLLDDVRALAAGIRDRSADIERGRTIPRDIIDDLSGLGVFRLSAPREAGGLEVEPALFAAVCEELGYADGSAGWVAMIAGATGIALAYLEPDVAQDMLADPRFMIAGVAAPFGVATPVDGGYRVRGRWPFASGCQHATWLVGGCRVTGDRPGLRMVIMPAADVTVHDTWDVAGLRGTGSHDIEAGDVFVPDRYSFSLAEPRTGTGALSGFPALSLLAMGIGAVPLGIARAAIDEFTSLATAKRDPVGGQSLAQKAWARSAVAEAESLRAAGLAYLLAEVSAGNPRDLAGRARLRLAIATATRNAARAVDLMYNAAGGTSVYASSPLQRHFRDVHAATQHAMVGPDVTETIGAVLLGEDVPTARL
jgi:alkylation response protein AidB-like acyl-CoA dehydrogenase